MSCGVSVCPSAVLSGVLVLTGSVLEACKCVVPPARSADVAVSDVAADFSGAASGSALESLSQVHS